MTTAATSLLGLALPVTGELSGTWGDTVNNSITALLDSAVAGTTTLSADVDVTLTTTTLAANQAREAIILWTAAGTVTRYITAPAQSKLYAVLNKSSTQSIVLRGVGPTTGVTILAGKQAMVAWDGTDYVEISSGYVDGPATSTDNAVARFDGTDGKLLQNSVVIIADTTGNMTGVGTLSSGAITSSALTATRVLFAGTSGLIQDDADLTFNGTILTSTGFAGPLNGTVGATTPAAGYFTDVSATGQVTSTKAGSATTGAGQFYLNGATSNRIDFNSNGATTPSFTTRSDGTKLTLFPALSGSQVDYAIGISAATQWYSVPVNSNSFFFKWFGGETQIASLDGTGALTLAGGVTLNGGTANGVTYLNGSKVLTSGTALTFDGSTRFLVNGVRLDIDGGTSADQLRLGTDPNYYKIGRNSSAGPLEFYGTQSGVVSYVFGGVNGEYMHLTSTGLGIGTSSPAQKLHLSVTSGAVFEQITSGSNNVYLGWDSTSSVGTFQSNTALTFATGASYTERIRLDVSGNLGIGTSSPAYKLDVRGVLGSGNGTITSGFSYDTGGLVGTFSNHALGILTNGAVIAKFDTSGNLGLGVTPSAWSVNYKVLQSGTGSAFAAFSGNDQTFVVSNAYNDGSWKYKNTAGAGYYQISGVGSGAHIWYNAPSGTADTAITFTQAMTLDASGNLLVGTTSSSSGITLERSGSVTAEIKLNQTGTGGHDYRIGSTGSGYGSAGNLIFYDATASAERMRLDASGNLLVGATANGGSNRALFYGSGGTNIRVGDVTNSNFRGYEFGGGQSDSVTYGSLKMELSGGELRITSGYSGYGGYQTFYTDGSQKMMLNTAGNLGLGVTPSAWTLSGAKALQVGPVASLSSYSAGVTDLGCNIYGGYSYLTSNLASFYRQGSGQHQWFNAPSGTAGAAITFTQAMTLDASGGLKTLNTIGVGDTAPATSGAGITFPATQSASSNANTLDDYEEGTWTPNQGSGLTVVGTFSSDGSYTKVGRLVTIRGIVFGATSVAASSAGQISSNLPFAPANDTAGSYFNGALSVGGQVDTAPTGVFAVGTIAATTGIYFSATYEV